MRAMIIALAEGELKNAHAGKFEFIAQRKLRRNGRAEVFGDDRSVAERLPQSAEQFVARHAHPFSANRVFRGSRNGPQFVKAQKMIDANGVKLAQRPRESLRPPIESPLNMHRPAIVRMPPQLSERREWIGRIT